MIILLKSIDIVLFCLLAVNVLYLLVFCVASRCKKSSTPATVSDYRRMAVLVPAYQEDEVIHECVESCLSQDYPREKYDVVVISDHMTERTNQALAGLPVWLVIATFENSTKTKALNLAMSQLPDYDIAVILDADNVIAEDFLTRINRAFERKDIQAYQTHRTAKNTNTNLAVLDAASEEINNSIFRQGHVNIGLSSALIGSGMAFEYGLLKEELSAIPAVGGFDRALELRLLFKGKRIGYLPDVYVLDEKIQNQQDFSRQRRRWMSAQVHYLSESMHKLPKALKERNGDFCDKLFQQALLPRLILIGFIFCISLVLTVVEFALSVKWWVLLGVLCMTLVLAIPANLYGWRLMKALIELPVTFYTMFLNLFRLKGANKKFIHTKHGVK